jgi:UDPglucose 6-dehydrogenase
VEKINQRRIHDFVEKIRKELWVVRGKTIAVWGLAFKPNTDDVRFAPSIGLIKSLLDEGATIRAYDPEATEKARPVLPDITYCADPYQAAEGADAVLIVTEWEEFLGIDWARLRRVVERPLILDGRNMLSVTDVTGHGFQYVSIGRPPAVPERKDSLADAAQVGAGSERAAASPTPVNGNINGRRASAGAHGEKIEKA